MLGVGDMVPDKQVRIVGKVFGVVPLPDDLGEIGIRPVWNKFEIFVRIKDDEGKYEHEVVVDRVERRGGVVDDIEQRREARRIRDARLHEIEVAIDKLDYPH